MIMYLVAFTGSLCSGQIETGTAIVIFRAPDGFIIGADSKIASNFARSPRCKIVQVDSVFVVSSGISSYRPVSFNVYAITKAVLATGGFHEARIDTIAGILKAGLANALSHLSRTNARKFIEVEEQAKKHGALCRVALLIMRDEPFMFTISFELERKNDTTMSIHITREDIVPPVQEDSFVVYWGLQNQNLTFLRDGSGSVASRILEFIRSQAAFSPATIGEPIHILHVNKRGAFWLDDYPECVPIVKYGME